MMKSQPLSKLMKLIVPGISIVYRCVKVSRDQTRAVPSSDTDINRAGKFFRGLILVQCFV